MNPHPPLSGFPVSIAVLLAVLEIKYIVWRSEHDSSIRNFLVAALVLFVPVTYYSGYWGAEYASIGFEVPQEAVAHHQLFAQGLFIATALLAVIHLLARSYAQRILVAVYQLAVLLVVSLTIYVSSLGGDLVFKLGAGVDGKALVGPSKTSVVPR